MKRYSFSSRASLFSEPIRYWPEAASSCQDSQGAAGQELRLIEHESDEFVARETAWLVEDGHVKIGGHVHGAAFPQFNNFGVALLETGLIQVEMGRGCRPFADVPAIRQQDAANVEQDDFEWQHRLLRALPQRAQRGVRFV